MIRKIEWIRDTFGTNILAVRIEEGSLSQVIEQMKESLSQEDYKKYVDNRIKSEGPSYLIIVADDIEVRSFSPRDVEKLKRVTDFEVIDIFIEGLGLSQHRENTSYYAICNSKTLGSIRTYLGLDQRPLFANLGFYPRDVSSQLKSTKLEKVDKFLKLLSQNYYKEGNFEFIKSVANYHLDKFDYIYPIKIESTTATFRDDNFNYFTISLIDDKFRVVAQWVDNRKLPYLSQTLIEKKLKNINPND